jgi:Gas vesicle synthesis protein GvpL/GvpF
VERWAAAQAPELLRRAQEEAVAELKAALVGAVLRGREAAPPPVPASPPPPARPRHGHALWVYCVAAEGALPAIDQPGVHPDGSLQRIEHDGLAVLASRVPLAEFGEEALRRNLNDLQWLERVARAHEAVLDRALELSTIVPLRLCTIYADERGVKRMLDEKHAALQTALQALEGHQEWAVKLLVDRATLEAAARARSPEATALEQEVTSRSGGGAYMLRRRFEREVRNAADRLVDELADDVHARLQDWADRAVLNAPQNPELSGHEGEMVLNAAYLVEKEKVPRLHELVDELQQRHGELGARLELTGPWPPYNFVPDTSGREAGVLE